MRDRVNKLKSTINDIDDEDAEEEDYEDDEDDEDKELTKMITQLATKALTSQVPQETGGAAIDPEIVNSLTPEQLAKIKSFLG